MNPSNLTVNLPATAVSHPQHRLSIRQCKAALMIAQEVPEDKIAAKIGINRSALARWKRVYPAFLETVERYRAQIRAEIVDRGIAQQHNRIKAADRRWRKMNDLLDARAEDAASNPEFVGVPGADTGLLVRQRKCIGGGQHGEFINEFVVDHDTLKEMRALEEHVAKELGQFEPDKSGPRGDQHQHVHLHFPTLTDKENAAAIEAQEADMPPAARRLLTRPSDGKPLDR